jgi:hypothetical protein
MLRKVLSILLSIQLLWSVQGFRLFAHYCHGHLIHVSVASDDDDHSECHSHCHYSAHATSVASPTASCCQKSDIPDCCRKTEENAPLDLDIDTVSPSGCCDTKVIISKSLSLNSFRPQIQIPPYSAAFILDYALIDLSPTVKYAAHDVANPLGALPYSPKRLSVLYGIFLI